MGTLAILGATGYTGRLCAVEAVDRGLDVILAGRNPDKLGALAQALGGPRTAVVDVNDGTALRALAEQADVLLTTVGPYLRWGRPAVLAALDGGCHYLDITGEIGFQAWVREQDEAARAAGVALCPAFGYDGVPGDLLAGIAAAGLGAPVDEARAAYLVRNGKPSGGTMRSMLGIARNGGVVFQDGALAPEAVGARSWRVPFPAPLGARAAVSAPLPDVLTLGPSTGAKTAVAYHVVPGAEALPRVAGPLGRVTRALLSSPVGEAMDRLADHLPEGPAPSERERMRAAVLAEVRGGGRTAAAWCRLRDAYGLTATLSVGLAMRLMDGGPHAGAFTPTQLLGADAGAFLQDSGVDWAMC